MVSRNDIRLINAVVIGLQESNYRFFVERKISKEEFLDALKYGYIALKWQSRNAGLAEMLKKEFMRMKEDVPDWWKWHFGWEKDYDISDYDTGNPLELAEKILLASKHGIPFKWVSHLYQIAYAWALNDDEEVKNDKEYILKVVRFVQLLSWADYDLPDLEIIKKFVIDLIKEKCSDDIEFKWIVFGDKEILDEMKVLYDKPYMWLLWKDVFGE